MATWLYDVIDDVINRRVWAAAAPEGAEDEDAEDEDAVEDAKVDQEDDEEE